MSGVYLSDDEIELFLDTVEIRKFEPIIGTIKYYIVGTTIESQDYGLIETFIYIVSSDRGEPMLLHACGDRGMFDSREEAIEFFELFKTPYRNKKKVIVYKGNYGDHMVKEGNLTTIGALNDYR